MEEVASKARLVDAEAVSADSALTATLPRTDIESALQDDAGADLFLEVARIENGERNDRTVKVEWTREDLQKLLAEASGDQITLTFDHDELQRMLGDDVEAHGLRERAAVLTVALVGAAGFAGASHAMVAMDGGSTPAPAAITGLVTDNSSGAVAAAAAPNAISGLVTDNSAGQGGVAAAPDAISGLVTDSSQTGQVGAVSGMVTDTTTSGEPGAVGGLVTDTGAEATRIPAAPAVAGDGSGFTLPDSAVQAAIAAGIAMLIVGAAFVGRSRRRVMQPA